MHVPAKRADCVRSGMSGMHPAKHSGRTDCARSGIPVQNIERNNVTIRHVCPGLPGEACSVEVLNELRNKDDEKTKKIRMPVCAPGLADFNAGCLSWADGLCIFHIPGGGCKGTGNGSVCRKGEDPLPAD